MHIWQENLRALLVDKETYGDNLRRVLGSPAKAAPQIRPLQHLRARRRRGLVMGDVHGTLSGLNCDRDLCKLLISYSRSSLPIEQQLPQDYEQLLNLPAETFNLLDVPIPAFNDPHEYDINHIRCVDPFHYQGCRHDWVWIKAGEENQFGALQGRLPGHVESLCKIRDPNSR